MKKQGAKKKKRKGKALDLPLSKALFYPKQSPSQLSLFSISDSSFLFFPLFPSNHKTSALQAPRAERGVLRQLRRAKERKLDDDDDDDGPRLCFCLDLDGDADLFRRRLPPPHKFLGGRRRRRGLQQQEGRVVFGRRRGGTAVCLTRNSGKKKKGQEGRFPCLRLLLVQRGKKKTISSTEKVFSSSLATANLEPRASPRYNPWVERQPPPPHTHTSLTIFLSHTPLD